jgi:hypothetical protein
VTRKVQGAAALPHYEHNESSLLHSRDAVAQTSPLYGFDKCRFWQTSSKPFSRPVWLNRDRNDSVKNRDLVTDAQKVKSAMHDSLS